MNPMLLPLAEAAPLLTGPQLTHLAIVLAGTGVVMVLIRLMGNWLAATHPEDPRKTALVLKGEKTKAPESAGIDPMEMVVVAAAAAVVIPGPHRIVAVGRPKAPPVDSLMQIWSMEGRRQIYSSHKIR